jgi:predicted DCC family thiol-disulfide oxidoreductase YuxK
MDERPVVLFDGVCNVCSWSVRFIHEHDDGQILFAPLQSDVGRDLLRDHGLPEDYFNSLVYVDDTGAHAKSDGALRIARHLDAPYRWAWHGRFVPRVVRDVAYDGFASIRYRVFGKKEECMVPSEELRSRFLAQST